MGILDNAKAHFKSKLDGDLLSLDVPEWDSTIHFKASLSLQERDPIYQLMNKGTMEAFAEALMIRALDENGNPLFKKVQRRQLMTKVDPDVIMRVINEISEMSQAASSEDAEKN